jgi:hypothetical protein
MSILSGWRIERFMVAGGLEEAAHCSDRRQPLARSNRRSASDAAAASDGRARQCTGSRRPPGSRLWPQTLVDAHTIKKDRERLGERGLAGCDVHLEQGIMLDALPGMNVAT